MTATIAVFFVSGIFIGILIELGVLKIYFLAIYFLRLASAYTVSRYAKALISVCLIDSVEDEPMADCPQCGSMVDGKAVVCGNCNALITLTSNYPSPSVTDESKNVELNARLKRAMRRTELLSYAAAALGLAILAVIILISFIGNNPGVA
jgi:hypothetical protein